jgi:hypothetical protein
MSLSIIRETASKVIRDMSDIAILQASVAEPPAPLVQLTVTAATKQVLSDENINNRDEFYEWRRNNGGGAGRRPNIISTPFYNKVRNLSADHWNTLQEPQASCQNAFEHSLPGYKTYKG